MIHENLNGLMLVCRLVIYKIGEESQREKEKELDSLK